MASVNPKTPSWYRKLSVAGVTGTNGKTSTSLFLTAALSRLHSPVVATTTVGLYEDHKRLDLPLTRDGMLKGIESAVSRGARFNVFELSSEVLARGFLQTYPVQVGVFTNLSHDHLDAHSTPEHYLASKAQLFMSLKSGGTAILNGADHSYDLLKAVVPKGVRVLSYAVPSRGPVPPKTGLKVAQVDVSLEGTCARLACPYEGIGVLETRAIGEVFAENAAAAFLAAVAMGVPPEIARTAIADAPAPPGRFEVISTSPCVVVDYAHTPDALQRTLQTARALCSGEVSLVFGAGGQRDQKKRPLMGAASDAADRVFLTSDNPREEDPRHIIRQIQSGMRADAKVVIEPDRRAAIAVAMRRAAKSDLVIVAGKGHETTQSSAGQTKNFSDVAVIQELSQQRTGAAP